MSSLKFAVLIIAMGVLFLTGEFAFLMVFMSDKINNIFVKIIIFALGLLSMAVVFVSLKKITRCR